MGTSAFDRLWDTPKKSAPNQGRRAGDFDALWGDEQADPNAALHAEFKSGNLAKRMATENAEDQAGLPPTITGAKDVPANVGSFLQKFLQEAPETVAAGVPGAKLLMSAGRSKLTGRPMADVQREVNAETSDVPYASAIGRAAGSLVTPGLKGAGAVKSGAILGGADQVLSNDESGVGSRLARGAGGATVGGIVGKGTEMLGTGIRAMMAKSLGQNALDRKAATSAVDKAMYGAAEREGAGKTLQFADKVRLATEDIAPYVQAIKDSRTFANADDATVLREAYKLMSERQGNLGRSMLNAGDFKAGSALEKADLGAAKKQVLESAKELMPSLPGANARHAQMMGETDTFRAGSDVARRVLGNGQVAGKKLTQNSAEAFEAALEKMTPEEATAAVEGILGRTKERVHLTANPLALFGVPTSLTRMARAGPLVRQADKAAGNTTPNAIQKAILALMNAGTNP